METLPEILSCSYSVYIRRQLLKSKRNSTFYIPHHKNTNQENQLIPLKKYIITIGENFAEGIGSYLGLNGL